MGNKPAVREQSARAVRSHPQPTKKYQIWDYHGIQKVLATLVQKRGVKKVKRKANADASYVGHTLSDLSDDLSYAVIAAQYHTRTHIHTRYWAERQFPSFIFNAHIRDGGLQLKHPWRRANAFSPDATCGRQKEEFSAIEISRKPRNVINDFLCSGKPHPQPGSYRTKSLLPCWSACNFMS